MKQILLSILRCPACESKLMLSDNALACSDCEYVAPLYEGKPKLTPIPSDIVPTVKKRRPKEGTIWRRANWDFYEEIAYGLSPHEIVLDIGAGDGYFNPLFKHTTYLTADIYPYDGVDLICDMTVLNPLRPASVDVIILSNVLEHVLDGQMLLTNLARALKPGGRLLVAVPFMIKVHQAPYDFIRYTHFALSQMLTRSGVEVTRMEAVYAPCYLVYATLRNLEELCFPASGLRGWICRSLLVTLHGSLKLLRRMNTDLEPGNVQMELGVENNPYPIGYQVVAQRPE